MPEAGGERRGNGSGTDGNSLASYWQARKEKAMTELHRQDCPYYGIECGCAETNGALNRAKLLHVLAGVMAGIGVFLVLKGLALV